jgi:hypothetical protein
MVFGFLERRSKKFSPPLSEDVKEHLIKMFELKDQADAVALLCQVTGMGGSILTSEECDRCRLAALKLSNGIIHKLQMAVQLFNTDPRDLLMQAGFGEDLQAYKKWNPEGFTDKWMSPISIALYPIIFETDLVPNEIVSSVARQLNDTKHNLDRMIQHIENELANPTQKVVDILKLRNSEENVRKYLEELVSHLKILASDKMH